LALELFLEPAYAMTTALNAINSNATTAAVFAILLI
jgi:hypothetical protein